VEFTRECLVFEVCQPHQAKKVLDQNMSVSTVLPYRISLYEEGGKTILATLRPTTMLAMFNVPQLESVAREVEDSIIKIIHQATSRSAVFEIVYSTRKDQRNEKESVSVQPDDYVSFPYYFVRNVSLRSG